MGKASTLTITLTIFGLCPPASFDMLANHAEPIYESRTRIRAADLLAFAVALWEDYITMPIIMRTFYLPEPLLDRLKLLRNAMQKEPDKYKWSQNENEMVSLNKLVEAAIQSLIKGHEDLFGDLE